MSECDTSGVKVGIGRGAVCVQVCVCVRHERYGVRGGVAGADCPWCLPLLNEVIASTLSICYRGSSSEQGVAMARCTQKGVAWERVQGSGVRVGGGQGSQPAGQHTRGGRGEKRRRESLVFFFLGPASGRRWTLTLN